MFYVVTAQFQIGACGFCFKRQPDKHNVPLCKATWSERLFNTTLSANEIRKSILETEPRKNDCPRMHLLSFIAPLNKLPCVKLTDCVCFQFTIILVDRLHVFSVYCYIDE